MTDFKRIADFFFCLILALAGFCNSGLHGQDGTGLFYASKSTEAKVLFAKESDGTITLKVEGTAPRILALKSLELRLEAGIERSEMIAICFASYSSYDHRTVKSLIAELEKSPEHPLLGLKAVDSIEATTNWSPFEGKTKRIDTPLVVGVSKGKFTLISHGPLTDQKSITEIVARCRELTKSK